MRRSVETNDSGTGDIGPNDAFGAGDDLDPDMLLWTFHDPITGKITLYFRTSTFLLTILMHNTSENETFNILHTFAYI